MRRKESKENAKSLRIPKLALYTMVLIVVLVIFLTFTFGKPKEDWIDIATYLSSSPLIVSLVVALIVFLALDRFRDLSKNVSDIEERLYDLRGSLNTELRLSIEDTQKKLTDKWERIENKVSDLTKDYPFLDDINNFELLVNANTAVAAMNNVNKLITSNRLNLAYEVLHLVATKSSSTDQAVSGAPKDFESLALVALVTFDDFYLCDLLLKLAGQSTNNRQNIWTARRIQLALIGDRLSLADQLSSSLRRKHSSVFRSKLFEYFGFKNSYENNADFEEIVSTLYLSSLFLDDQGSFLFSRKLKREFGRLSREYIEYASIAEGFIKNPQLEDAEIPEYLLNSANQSPSAILAVGMAKHSGSNRSIDRVVNALGRGRPILSRIYSSNTSIPEDMSGHAHAQPVQEQPAPTDGSSTTVDVDELFPDRSTKPGLGERMSRSGHRKRRPAKHSAEDGKKKNPEDDSGKGKGKEIDTSET